MPTKMPKMPYMPEQGQVAYVPATDPIIAMAKAVRDLSGCVKQRTGAVVVSPSSGILGRGNNDTTFRPDTCPRDTAGCKTGEGYGLCQEVCGQRPGRHAERDAIADALSRGPIAEGSTLYLYGHWWCCEPCWDAMLGAGINRVYLLEGVGPDTDWRAI